MAEIYSATLVVAITLSLGYAVYAYARFPLQRMPVFTIDSHPVFGTPSLLYMTVNSSSPAILTELTADGASSTQGILSLTGSGYTTTRSLCEPGITTFFSVVTGTGALLVSSDGKVWIDGVKTNSATVSAGQHEIVISGASSCTVTLPGGIPATYPSPAVSTIPAVSRGQNTYLLTIPFVSSGHTLVLVYDRGLAKYGF